MNPRKIIAMAEKEGLTLKLLPNRKIKLAGNEAIYKKWVGTIAENKEQIIRVLESENREFISVSTLYKKARTTAQCLGEIKLTRGQCYATSAVLVGTGWKLRKWDRHKAYKEPWLLVSSLPQVHDYATKIAKCYNARMQIEESFRDQKSHTYGLGSEDHKTYKIERLKALILLAALAHWLHYMLG